jgi:hypothetical protein
MVSTKTLASSPTFYGNSGASQTPGPSFPINSSHSKLSSMETLDMPDLSILLNEPIFHDPHWPPFLNTLPSDILKFEGNPIEDLGDHVMNFHLWWSSNLLKDNSLQLHLFQCTLIGGVAKWYIELNGLR